MTVSRLLIALAVSTVPSVDADPAYRASTVRIDLADGSALAADVYLPAPTGRFPVIVEVTPYGRRNEGGSFVGERAYWTKHGYAFVVVDARGQGDSAGRFDFFQNEAADNRDTIEWIARQPWSNGKVGMRGSSYTGTNQWYAAKARPPHLRCITPSAAVASPMDELPFNGGAFKQGWALPWISALSDAGLRQPVTIDWARLVGHRPLLTADVAAFGRVLPLYRRMLAHPRLDAYWRAIRLTPADYRRIDIPSLAFTGWFDGTLPGTIRHYRDAKRFSPARDRQWLVIGPWEHYTAPDGGLDMTAGTPVSQVGGLRFPRLAFLPGRELTRAFFDACLKNGRAFNQPSALVYLTGADRWLALPTYPPPRVRTMALYLHSGGSANTVAGDGSLTPAVPGRERADAFQYDPRSPLPSQLPGADGRLQGIASRPIDITPLLRRPDVLVYTGAPLTKALTVLGEVALDFYAASDARDTDFTSQIEDVGPDGRAVRLGAQNGGVIRARYRDGYAREQFLTPGVPTRFRLTYFDIGHQFRPGHRIRISVSSSAYPWVSINPNTGGPIATDIAPARVARQRLFHDAAHPSRLLLSVLPEPIT